ncbi:hypothetical protein [Mycobacterium decipiens]|nr:hypothetical protein [Mycobacterium decipiens]
MPQALMEAVGFRVEPPAPAAAGSASGLDAAQEAEPPHSWPGSGPATT